MAKNKKIVSKFDHMKIIDQFVNAMNSHDFFLKDRVSTVTYDTQLVEQVTHSNKAHAKVIIDTSVNGEFSFSIEIYKSSTVVSDIPPFWNPRAIINGKFFTTVGNLHLEVLLPIVYKIEVPMIDDETYMYKPKYNHFVMWENIETKINSVVATVVEVLELADRQAEESKQ